mgnify:CR=1 FL=1
MSHARLRRLTPVFALAAAFSASPARAQYEVGAGVDYLSYAFDAGLGADAAQLFMIPVALRVPATSALSFDVYSAWAEGRVERADTVYKLSGPVDTGVRAAYQATPWALVTVGANVPTGDAQHDGQEAIVAALLSTDLLGFREASWGRGLALTGSVAIARSMGNFGLGLAGAYSMRSKFTPTAGDSLEYQPGDETRVRLGIDRNFGNSTLTLGGTFINYTIDQANGLNLFQAGQRFRFDATYAFRMGAGVWTIYAADLIRQGGTLTLPNLDSQGVPLPNTFTDINTPKQNLTIAGFMGSMEIGGGFVFRPHVDFKLQSREDSAGSDAGSGWLVAAGGDIPMRIFGGHDFFPKGRVLIGSLKDATGGGVRVFGMEFRGTVRASF